MWWHGRGSSRTTLHVLKVRSSLRVRGCCRFYTPLPCVPCSVSGDSWAPSPLSVSLSVSLCVPLSFLLLYPIGSLFPSLGPHISSLLFRCWIMLHVYGQTRTDRGDLEQRRQEEEQRTNRYIFSRVDRLHTETTGGNPGVKCAGFPEASNMTFSY